MTEAAAPPRVELWFDFASTYSYLAVMRAPALAARMGVQLAWRPFLLGPVFKATGWSGAPFTDLPVKSRYMWTDLARQCAKYGLPWQQPAQFPKRSVLACQLGVLGQDAAWMGDYCRAVMHAAFVEDLDIDAPATLEAILAHLGLPAQALLAEAGSADNRARLRAQTGAALEAGIFGAPTVVAAGELWWGNDRLDDALAAAVRGPGP